MKFDFTGIILIVAGLLLISFRSWYAMKHVQIQNKAFGFKFGEKELEMTKTTSIIVGTIFLTFGILIILGILKIRT